MRVARIELQCRTLTVVAINHYVNFNYLYAGTKSVLFDPSLVHGNGKDYKNLK